MTSKLVPGRSNILLENGHNYEVIAIYDSSNLHNFFSYGMRHH